MQIRYTKAQLEDLFQLHVEIIRLQGDCIRELREQIALLLKSNDQYQSIALLLESPEKKTGQAGNS